ncbi:hypothetical protein ATJ88_1877 [Isoptericola jiangsuensis]|uniref:Uncharacterized protein n=1 Tax=Isoptericola jiangsuensis TaxID=548579 RepID=A0A2A9EWT4_9MICO|nr:hypothetical protein [Isoptericola jiangsuensis]PFG43193.1 hypothetical protein ATJ88_1877 [Isoptericola jiangsuensis]
MDGWVWVLLAVAAAGFLGWVVWGVVAAGLRLLRQGARSAQVLGDGTERIGDAVARAQEQRASSGPTMFDDRAVLRDRVRALRTARRQRVAERRARQEPVWLSWRESTWLERRTASRRNGT